MNIDWNALLTAFLPALKRLVIIVFSTLGVVYIAGRLLFPKLKDSAKNRIAALALLSLAYAITLAYDYPSIIDAKFAHISWQYVVGSFIYAMFGAVFYVVIGWRFYSRMDNLLDRKWGKDNRRKK